MIFLLFNGQVFPIILNWQIFWILVVHISRSVVSCSVTLVLVVQLLVVQSLVIQSLVIQSFSRIPWKRLKIGPLIYYDSRAHALWAPHHDVTVKSDLF